MTARPRVVLDLVPLHPGRGGAGGGIWSYAAALATQLDRLAPDDVEIVCLMHPGQELPLRHVRRIVVPVDTRAVPRRLAWIHRGLPAWCGRHGAAVLHKLATEVPWTRPGSTRLLTTVQDFMGEYYQEQRATLGADSLAGWPHRAYFAAVTRRCFATSDLVLTTTAAVAGEARLRFPAAAPRLRTVPLGVAHEALAPLPGAGAGRAPVGRPPAVLCVGAFLPHKGQREAVAAFSRFAARWPEAAAGATLTLRGHVADAAYHADVRADAASSAASSGIVFASYDAAASPGAVYEGADVLLQLSAYEGFGLPPLEAQAAGVPVICSDIPVFREVLGDGACFVPRDDAEGVAAAIRRLACDPDERERLVARGRANASRFSWARTARETLELYRALAGIAPT
ncbi:MAG TPA: glycosyltransferase family 1 protein [Gemmatimonadales bacterium]